MKSLLTLAVVAALIAGAVFLIKRHRAQQATASNPLPLVVQTTSPTPVAASTVGTRVTAPLPARPASHRETLVPATPAVAAPAAAPTAAPTPSYLRRLLNGELPQPGKNVSTVQAGNNALFSGQPNLQRLLKEQPTAK